MIDRSDDGASRLAVVASRPAEFEAFYHEHLPFVRSYLARRVDDASSVADLTADVFVEVIRSAGNYRLDLGPPRAWLVGIARHVVADHHQGVAREKDALGRWQGSQLLDEDCADRIVHRISAEVEARTVLAAIAQLSDALRDVVELVAVDGLAVVDAAAVLGISPVTARVRYYRARRLLHHTPVSPLLEVTT